MIIKVKKLVPEAVVPQKAHKGDAGYDLVAVSRRWDDEEGCWVYGTGLALEIAEGAVGLVFPRSSIAKKDVFLTNGVGVIDSGYRGEVMAKFKGTPVYNGGGYYKVGERIAQLVVVKLPDVQLIESDELSESDRGEGGYGSTGK